MISDILESTLENVSFDQVIQQIKQGIMITDTIGHILYVNTTFCGVTGYEPKEIIGKTPDILKSEMHDDDFYRFIWTTLYEDGYWQGEVYNRNKAGEIYLQWLDINDMKNDQGEVTRYVFIFTDIQKHKQAQKDIAFLAYHDPLTKLPNRLYVHQHLQSLLNKEHEHQQMIALLYLDLDRFKQINDTLGHSYGDEVLIQAASRVESCLRKSDMVSRVGGDEFICILSGISSQSDAETVAQKIIKAISQPFYLDNFESHISVSIGISFYPYDGDDIETLVTYADSAMYRAKKMGSNQYQLAQVEENAGAFEKLIFENSLRNALQEETLTLHYQPLIDTKTHKVSGFEALLRWEHPDFGTVSPMDFIPLAEETGLIIPIGEWVMRTACRQNMSWQRDGSPPTRMAVNISTLQILDSNFLKTVLEILEETKMPADLLELEITETIFMEESSSALLTLRQLREKGVRISIDDFGTGYSSLYYLKSFPVDTIKIDRTLIQDINTNQKSEAIAHSVISLANNLNMKVIAEGVETIEQLSILREPKCDEIQGFLFSKPIPSSNVMHWMENNYVEEKRLI
ncbi:putative bifunctional diguanylate cyclase/phosphodiesterase [Bacillus dakarensis]|uniref:putative bifunctional diguanylate cyclase/phosphodiesterase n=1 Tax=Robertmurraya dakarensis TaxID=1926278 RepID=UPI000980DA1D|nr:EAL domain-containing protein [Bacillus dakarensis]